MTGPRPPSQRQRKVGESLRHIVAEALARGGPWPPGLRVVEVRPAPDLRTARVYVSVPQGADAARALDALQAEAHALQAAINRGVRMKFTPRLTFVADDTAGRAARIEAILREVRGPGGGVPPA